MKPTSFFLKILVPSIAVTLIGSARAGVISQTRQVNSVEQNQVASPWFTASPDNLIGLTNIATTVSPGLIGGDIGAGDGAISTSTGTITLEGTATSIGGWTDGNGVPAGVTLSFNVQFTTKTTNENSFLTTQANSGTQLGNGVGITQTAGTVGDIGTTETLEVSGIAISGVSFTGAPTEPGFTFTPGTVTNAKWNRIRGNNFAEASEGVTILVGEDSWGFGTSVGTLAGNLFIDNAANYPEVHSSFVTAGPMVFRTDAGVWNLKGLGFQYEMSYEMEGEGVVPTWTGSGGNSMWSTAANWTGNMAPTNGQPVRFGAAARQTSTNDIANLEILLINFTNGGFNLYGLALTNSFGISNLAGINNLNLDVIYTGGNDRVWHVETGTQLGIHGAIQSYDSGNIGINSGGTVNVLSGGSISLMTNAVNGNVRLGTTAGDSITMNLSGTVNIPNAPTTANANRLRVGAVAGSSGVLNINSGGAVIAPDDAGNPARSLVEVGFGDGTVSVLNLNAGGLLHAQRVEANGGANPDSTINFNGGLFEAHRIAGSTTIFNNMDRAQVRAGGAFVHTTNSITFVLPLTEDPGSTGGGLTKLGEGLLVLPLGNSYTGPTVVSGGTLSVGLPLSSSGLTLGAGATLNLGVNGQSWGMNSATFNEGSTLNLDFGGEVGAAPIVAGTVTRNGTTVINILGTITSTGSYPIIDYTTLAGSGSFQLGARPPGVVATLVINAGTTSIDLVVSDLAADLYWTGAMNSDWDIGLTENWAFLSGGSATYNENASVGDFVTFFDGQPNTAITLKASVKPAQMKFSNFGTPYSIGGPGFGIYGIGRVLMEGGGVVTLTTDNSFSGGVSNNIGFVEIGHNNALGTGPVTLWPTLSSTLSTGLRSDGGVARTIANPVQFRSFAVDEVNFKMGDATKNGRLIFTGDVDLSNRRNEMSTDSDIVFAGTLRNGTFSKTGTGRLIVTGSASLTADDQILTQGDVIIDGGAWTNGTFGVRLVAADGVTSRVILTNNGVITLEGGSSLRVAGVAEGSFTQGNGTNEFIMYSGNLNLVGTTAELSVGGGGSLSSLGRILLYGGTTTLRGLRALPNAGPSEVELSGATLIGSTNGGARLGNFISGFTNVTILAGGVTLNIPAGVTAVASQSLEGSGGINKGGDGLLYLDGANTYAGATFANAGGLGGTGVISGPVTIGPAATLVPGTSPAAGIFTSLGALTINNSLSLGGSALFEVDKETMTSDLVNAASVSYAGTLVVTNTGATPLIGGEVFQLFNVAGAKSGDFIGITILPHTGVVGTFDPATGRLTIVSGTPPSIDAPAIIGGDFVLTGSGFPAGETYSILTTINVADPVSLWITNSTGVFSGSGSFSNAIPLGTEPQQFFRIKTP